MEISIAKLQCYNQNHSDLFTCHGFQQIIDIPTRIAENTVSLISLIFMDNPDDVVCHGTLHKIADHDVILRMKLLYIIF